MFASTRAIAQKYGAKVVLLSIPVLPLMSHAEGIDNTEALAAIAAAGVAVLAVIAAMTVFRVSKWGALQVAKLFGR